MARRPGDSDGFARVLGQGRGITDVRVLSGRLAGAERERDDALTQARELQSQLDTQRHRVLVLSDRLDDCESKLFAAGRERDVLRRDRDAARYAAIRAGTEDPVDVIEEVHHGIWTPGRPYLEAQHVTHPDSGECYRAVVGGARPGTVPVAGPAWMRCRGTCPAPVIPKMDPHPIHTGFALRQTESWWEASLRQLALTDLESEHLVAVISWLHRRAGALWCEETGLATPLVPCPVNAYPGPGDWLLDTPLWRALVAEKRRRGISRSRHAPAENAPWRWGDELPF